MINQDLCHHGRSIPRLWVRRGSGSAPRPTPRLGCFSRGAKVREERINIHVSIDQSTCVRDGAPMEMMLSRDGWILNPRDVAVERIRFTVDFGRFRAMSNAAWILKAVQSFERCTVAVLIYRWIVC